MMEQESKERSDHDLLIEAITILREVKKGHENHLEHHRRHDSVMLSVTLGSLFTAVIAVASSILAYMK